MIEKVKHGCQPRKSRCTTRRPWLLKPRCSSTIWWMRSSCMTIRLRSFSISLHGTVPMKVGAILFIRGGRRISISRYGSCETSHTGDSEGIERHLEAPISLTGKKDKKEEPKTNNRQCLVFVLGSYWRRQRDSNPCGRVPKRFSRHNHPSENDGFCAMITDDKRS